MKDVAQHARSIHAACCKASLLHVGWKTELLGFLRFADLQMVNITLRVLSKPRVDQLPTIFKVPLCCC